jgi:hypothetical protein
MSLAFFFSNLRKAKTWIVGHWMISGLSLAFK